MTTASAVVFIALLVAMLAGMLVNPYAGLVVFVAIPAFFVLGLLLIPVGARLQRRAQARHPEAVVDWPVLDFRRASVRRTAVAITALTAVNVVIILLAGYGGLHWMESPTFCGQVCHTPMQPQFAAWSASAHTQIACAECHIGEGAAGFVQAKLSGVRQLAHVIINTVPKPIPPGAEMGPGLQAKTCTGCHQPGRRTGDRLRVVREYADDEANAETATTLQLHVNPGSTTSTRAIHWHANPAIRIEDVATDPRHETIPYVKVTDAQGNVKEYVAPDTSEADDQHGRAPGDGLHRLPQHGGAPHLGDTRESRRQRHRCRTGEPHAAVRTARRRAAGQGVLSQPGRGRQGNR